MILTKSKQESLIKWMEPLLGDLGIELVSVDMVSQENRKILRVIIDTEEGVTLGHCERVSRKLSLALDVEDSFSFEYHLEVTSPGIFRELRKSSELKRFRGSRVKAVFNSAEKKKDQFIGVLDFSDEHFIRLKVKEEIIELERGQIGSIQLYPEI